MNQFKVGDIVKCTSGYHCFIEVGQTYTIAKIVEDDVFLENKEYPYFHGYFELAKPVFDMVNEPWFICVSNQSEFELAKEFIKSKGFQFGYGEDYNGNNVITNRDSLGNTLFKGINYVMRSCFGESEKTGSKEIKLNFKTTIDSVEYPEVKSAQQVEIEQIETEMRKLADRLKEIKGDCK